MAINLQKGQNISLNKEAPGMQEIHLGLGWDVRQSTGADFDVDAFVFGLGEDGKVVSDGYFIFYNQLQSPDGGIQHTGDNLTGEGEGDDESIHVFLNKLADNVAKIAVCVNIHEAEERKQNFGMIENAFIRVVNKSDDQEIARFDLSEDFSIENALIVGEVYKRNGEWKFKAVGQGFSDGLVGLCKMYGVNV